MHENFVWGPRAGIMVCLYQAAEETHNTTRKSLEKQTAPNQRVPCLSFVRTLPEVPATHPGDSSVKRKPKRRESE